MFISCFYFRSEIFEKAYPIFNICNETRFYSMVRRILYILFLGALIGSIAYFYVSYKGKSNKTIYQNPFVAVPKDAALIFHLNDLHRFTKEFDVKTEMFKGISQLPVFQHSVSAIHHLDSIVNQNSEVEALFRAATFTITWQMVGPKRIEPLYVLTFRSKESAIQFKHVLDKKIAKEEKVKEYNGVEIYPVRLPRFGDGMFFFFQKYNYVVLGKEPLILEKSIGEIDLGGSLAQQSDFMDVVETSGTHVPVNVYVNFSHFSKMAQVWAEPGKRKQVQGLAGIGSWVELDLKLDDKAFLLDGFGSVNNMDDYFSVILSQAPVKFTTYKYLPITTRNFVFMGIDNITEFRSKFTSYIHGNQDQKQYEIALNRIQNKTGEDAISFFDALVHQEICAVWDAGLNEEYNNVVMMKVKSRRSAEGKYKEYLDRYAASKKVGLSHYTREVVIGQTDKITTYHYPFEDALSLLYGDFINDQHLRYVCFYDNFLMIAPSVSAIKSIVLENMRQRTLEADERYMAFSQTLSEHTSLFWYLNMQNWDAMVKNQFKDDEEGSIVGQGGAWNGFQALGVQVAALNNLVYNNVYLRYDPFDMDRPQTVWESKLDSFVVNKPALLVNHYTKEKEIAVQDASNTLYLMNNAGIVLWKKKLDSRIISEISQVDYYKNGKLQLLFNTSDKIYLLDRNGNNVERYPVNLPSEATAGLSLFDYDNKKNYRIFIPCENRKVYLFTKEGNINTGWKFGRSDHPVTTPIQYFRIGNRDFIIFKDKTRLYIQDRQGKTRIRLKQQFSPSEKNKIYSDYSQSEGKNRFVTTANDGTVKFIYLDGSVKEHLMVSCQPDHFFELKDLDGDKKVEYIFVSANKLQVMNRKGQQVFQHEFASDITIQPNLYQFASNNVKIGITESSVNELYLFSFDGNLYKGFPLKGQTEFSIGFLNQQGYRFNLLVGGKNGFLLNYKVK